MGKEHLDRDGPKRCEISREARDHAGFSLVEVLLVVSVIVVIMAVATPSVVRAIRRYQAESSARKIATILLRARSEAVKRNQRISTVFVAPTGSNDAIYGADLNGNGILDPDEPWMMAAHGILFWKDNTPTAPPTSGLPADYTSLSLAKAPTTGPTAYSVTFSAQGTVVTNNSGSWQLASQAVGICVTDGKAVDTAENSWLIAITPAARIRIFYWAPGRGWKPA